MEARMNTRVGERRPLGALGRIGVVAGLHVAVVYLVATGLGIVPALVPERMVGTIVPDTTVPEERPAVIPPPDFPETIRVQVPEPVTPPLDHTEATDSIGAEAVPDPVPLPPIDQAPSPVLTAVRPDARHPLSQPPYPMSAVRAEQEGAVEIEVYVLPNGRVGDARVLRSTGFAALDQSALDEARRRWRLLPATRDGVPYAQWHRLRVVFELRNR
jgi:protein TonB